MNDNDYSYRTGRKIIQKKKDQGDIHLPNFVSLLSKLNSLAWNLISCLVLQNFQNRGSNNVTTKFQSYNKYNLGGKEHVLKLFKYK